MLRTQTLTRAPSQIKTQLKTNTVEAKLCREVLRKLRLAIESEEKEDRDIICAEVFADVVGALDEGAKEELGITGDCRFYQVLAPYYCRAFDLSEALLYTCRRLWGQPYVAPIFTLLLHQWLLLNTEAGGQQQRQKHLNVLASGAKQLFLGDVHSNSFNLRPLYEFFLNEIVFNLDRHRLDALPLQSRTAILSVVASYLPYYAGPEKFNLAMEDFPVPDHNQDNGTHMHSPGEGADFLISEVTHTLRKIRTEGGFLRYMTALQTLKGSAYIASVRTMTKLMLQAELYSLTFSGGPRYAPKSVNKAARKTLDTLFPIGQRSRKVVRFLFRLFNPTDWILFTYNNVQVTVAVWFSFWATVLQLLHRLLHGSRSKGSSE